MISFGPRSDLPIGWSGNAVSWNWSNSFESGESRVLPISWSITPLSTSNSSSAKVEFCKISVIRSEPGDTVNEYAE